MAPTVPIAMAGSAPASAAASSRASPAIGSSATTNGTKPKATTQIQGNGYHPTNSQIPLSSMRSAPLDLASVERRGQHTSNNKEVAKRSRPHGLEEAPTFRPTQEEFKDPFQYIRKISSEAKKFGICKIIPPDSWNPDFAIDTEVRNWLMLGGLDHDEGHPLMYLTRNSISERGSRN